MVTVWNKHQVSLYFLALLLGAGLGLSIPAASAHLAVGINPVLMLLLYATFLGVPFMELPRVAKDVRFLSAVIVINFVLVPVVVYGLTRLIANDIALVVGVMLVLLAPCIDYVIVFSGLAGSANDRLLALSPLLMLLQMLLLPVYMKIFIAVDLSDIIEIAPFAHAFFQLILVPLVLATLTQVFAPPSVSALCEALMVPLMMLTLTVVVASQVEFVRHNLSALVTVIPIYVLFLIIMVPLGIIVGRSFRLDIKGVRALVFSGATRNSLVVLPLALAISTELSLVPAVVVTQTLVELIGMVVYVRVVPSLVS